MEQVGPMYGPPGSLTSGDGTQKPSAGGQTTNTQDITLLAPGTVKTPADWLSVDECPEISRGWCEGGGGVRGEVG